MSIATAEPNYIADRWQMFTSSKGFYEGGLAEASSRTGKLGGLLRSKREPTTHNHALLLQEISAQQFLGRRIVLTGYLRTEEVDGWAGLWLRVDDATGKVLSFENMMERPVVGTTDWTPYKIELDVPVQAQEIHFGALLAGSGLVRVDDFTLEVRGPILPGLKIKQKIRSLPEEAGNLGFEE